MKFKIGDKVRVAEHLRDKAIADYCEPWNTMAKNRDFDIITAISNVIIKLSKGTESWYEHELELVPKKTIIIGG